MLVYLVPEGGPPADAHVIDNTDGTYTCTYLPTLASPNCRVTVTVNGTHVVGSPFPAAVQPGRTDAQQSEVYGHGLNDGVSGAKNFFTIQTKDPYGNRCVYNDGAKDHFSIRVFPVASLLPEYNAFMKKYSVTPIIIDNEDGTHSVEYTCDYAGFYAIEVTLANVPVGDSPYNACICNPTISFPPEVVFKPLCDAEVKGVAELPQGTRACDMVQLYDLIVMLKSQPIELTNNRREREYLHFYKLKSAMARGKEQWESLTLRGRMLPPPMRRECLALDQRMLCLAHSDDAEEVDEDGESTGGFARTSLNDLRILDLSDLKAACSWTHAPIDGKPPNAIEGYAVAMWKERASILVAGGLDPHGKATNDVWMLTLGGTQAAPNASWRCLQEWPASIFAGTQFTDRCNFSLTCRDGTASFYVFGGRNSDGELLDDLYCFDMAEEQYTTPQVLSERPLPREHHAACFVADRYLVVYGGVDAEGKLFDTAVVYDIVNATWSTIEKIEPRARHRLENRGGVMYVLGGVDAEGNPAEPLPLSSQVFNFAQKSSFDFVGNNAQAIVVKPAPNITNLRQFFTVEAVFYARSFSANPYNPVLVKTDNLKTGFGLVGQEHPAFKGDPEEGPWIHFFVGQWTAQGSQLIGTRIDLEEWIHAVATYNGAELRLYINGSLKAQIDYPEKPMPDEEAETLHSKGDILIGGMPGKYAFDGFIDECRLWDVCRNDDEIKAHMNEPCTADRTPRLLGQWTFNEGAGDAIIDSSGARNHAQYDRYAGGVELRRVQSKRPEIKPFKSEREKHIDENFEKLKAWKEEFEKDNGRPPSKAEIMMHPEMGAVARRLGEFGVD